MDIMTLLSLAYVSILFHFAPSFTLSHVLHYMYVYIKCTFEIIVCVC